MKINQVISKCSGNVALGRGKMIDRNIAMRLRNGLHICNLRKVDCYQATRGGQSRLCFFILRQRVDLLIPRKAAVWLRLPSWRLRAA